MKGHIKVTKIYDTHQEVIVDDSNMLVEGFKVDIVSILTGEATSIPSIVPSYFQVGASGMNAIENGLQDEGNSGIFYHLSAPLSTVDQYGQGTSLELENLNRSFVASSDDVIDEAIAYQEMLFLSAAASDTSLSATTTKQLFGPVLERNIAKNYIDSIEIRFELDKKTANGILIREFGLFARNPGNYRKSKPLLLAYKQLNEPFTKRGEFKLLIDWSIGFLGNTNIYDNVTPGFK